MQNPNQNGKYPYTLVIVFEKIGESFEYKRIELEETDRERVNKYLYCRGGSNGPNLSPTAQITEISKTYKNRIRGWFKKYEKEHHLFESLNFAFKKSEENILRELSEKYATVSQRLKKNESCVITLAIEENGKLKYIGEYEEFKNLLIELIKETYKEVCKEDHICSICGEKKDEVYGNALSQIFKFYTLDKPGYIAGGFNKFDAWKNAPVCLECALKVEEGKKFLDEHKSLSPKMGGMQYYLIPKFIFGQEEAKEIMEHFFTTTSHPEETLKNKSLERISNDENELLDVFKEYKDFLTFNFLFYEKTNSAFKINLLIEDILPSRINIIFKAKKQVEEHGIFKNLEISRNKYDDIKFNFDELRRFIPSKDVFLEVVDKTFRGIKLHKELLFHLFMQRIRQDFLEGRYLKHTVLQAFISLLFLNKLKLLSSNMETFTTGGKIMSELREKAESFFNEFPDSFTIPIYKAVFLLGVLTQKLLNIQYQERESKPFLRNLKSLKMKESDFKGLLPKIIAKLEQYGKNYYRDLESLISAYFLEAGKGWKLSSDELNFYFVLGMNLEKEIDRKLNLTKEKE